MSTLERIVRDEIQPNDPTLESKGAKSKGLCDKKLDKQFVKSHTVKRERLPVSCASSDDLNSMSSLVRINVGGVVFVTTRATLLPPGADPSFFSALLSGRVPTITDSSGALFVDRDPKLFEIVLNFLRSGYVRLRDIDLGELKHESDFYGVTSLSQHLELLHPGISCGGLLFDTLIPPESLEDGPVSHIASAHTIVAAAYKYNVCCWKFSESRGWTLVGRSPTMDHPIDKIAIYVKGGSMSGCLVAIAAGSLITLWRIDARDASGVRDAASPTGQDPILSEEEDAISSIEATLDLTVSIDDLLFINSNLVAISRKGKVGVRNARTLVWQVQDVEEITSYAAASSLLLLGSHHGRIYHVDLQKFPLRLKDNDLLINVLYKDPHGEGITALSVFVSNSSVERCVEIAYGTAAGGVHLVLQHPENVGQAPLLYQTYQVHLSPIKFVKLNEHSLISVCSHNNHVRTWRIARFRGRISTQPGSQAMASFCLPSYGHNDIGPFGDVDEQQLFVQQPAPNTTNLVLTSASTCTALCHIEAADGSPIWTFHVHATGMAARAGSRTKRLLFTGHDSGAIQVWNLSVVLDAHSKSITANGNINSGIIGPLQASDPSASIVSSTCLKSRPGSMSSSRNENDNFSSHILPQNYFTQAQFHHYGHQESRHQRYSQRLFDCPNLAAQT
eukprot:gene2250-5253_t